MEPWLLKKLAEKHLSALLAGTVKQLQSGSGVRHLLRGDHQSILSIQYIDYMANQVEMTGKWFPVILT